MLIISFITNPSTTSVPVQFSLPFHPPFTLLYFPMRTYTDEWAIHCLLCVCGNEDVITLAVE